MRILPGGFLAALLIVIAAPAPAHATTVVYDVTSAFDQQVEKTAVVKCPDGESVLGVGGWINPGGVMLTAIAPSADLRSAIATGRAQPGFAASWSVTVRAVCGTAEVEREVGTGSFTATATCDTNKVLYSNGYLIERPTGSQYVYGVIPTPTLSSVTVHAAGVATSSEALSAIAICGPIHQNDPFWRHVRNHASTPRDDASTKSATAGKPHMNFDMGSTVLGGGALIHGTGAFLDGLRPNETLDSASARAARITTTGRAKAASMAAPTADDGWDMEVYSACIGSWY